MTGFAGAVVTNMLEFLSDVMMNQFGNYLCQKLIEVCSVNDIKKIVGAILPSVIEISMDNHGTRVIQSLIETLGKYHLSLHSEIIAIINELNTEIFTMIVHANGNHVIQQFLLVFRASEKPGDPDIEGSDALGIYTNFIFNSCMQSCDIIGTDKHGCCVMQRCLEKGLMSQKLALSEIINSRLHLMIEDQYGNYLVQNVIKLCNDTLNEQILNFIAGDFIRLSQMKFSSNVIEKCLETKQASEQVSQILMGTHFWDDQILVRELGSQSRD